MRVRSNPCNLIVLLAVSTNLAAIAQDKPLAGSIQMNVEPSIRIDRSSLRRTASASAGDFSAQLQPQEARLAPLIDTNLFKVSANQSQNATASLASGLVQEVTNRIQSAAPPLSASTTKSDTKDKLPPYIWYQSAQGGYFDGSCTTSEVVRADRLHLFGGKFADGTAVPKAPITDYNSMGHAFKQSRLNTNHFWSH